MPVNIGGKLGFDHGPLQAGQNILALAQRQTKILKPVGAFIEVEDRVVGDQLAVRRQKHEAEP